MLRFMGRPFTTGSPSHPQPFGPVARAPRRPRHGQQEKIAARGRNRYLPLFTGIPQHKDQDMPTLASIHLYPIKSTAGMPLERAG